MTCEHDSVLQGLSNIIHPDHAALIVIDVQNDFLHENGFTAKAGVDVRPMQAAMDNVNGAIGICHDQGVPVIFVREIVSPDTVLPNYLTRCGSFDQCPVRIGTWGAEFYDRLSLPLSGDPIVEKPCYDGFQDSVLDVTLRSRGIRTCLYVGFASNVCVDATARHGFVLGYYTVLLSDATAGDSQAAHEACLLTWQSFFGPVITTSDLSRHWPVRAHSSVPANA